MIAKRLTRRQKEAISDALGLYAFAVKEYCMARASYEQWNEAEKHLKPLLEMCSAVSFLAKYGTTGCCTVSEGSKATSFERLKVKAELLLSRANKLALYDWFTPDEALLEEAEAYMNA